MNDELMEEGKKKQDMSADNTIHLLPDTVNVYSCKHKSCILTKLGVL